MLDNAEGKDMVVDEEAARRGPRRKKLREMELMREEGLRKEGDRNSMVVE
jgi:hypothetical protein